jgi:hypothetical protein
MEIQSGISLQFSSLYVILSYVFSMSYKIIGELKKSGFGLFSGLSFLKSTPIYVGSAHNHVWDKFSVSLQGCTSPTHAKLG